jgi:hypothetical protein
MRQGSKARSRPRRAAALAAIAFALPLAGCSAAASASGTEGAVDLVRAGCPADIRVQIDDHPGVEWGFLYSLLDAEAVDIRNMNRAATAPLVIDGEPTGVDLTILTGESTDGVSANTDLYDDEELLLAAVDTDAALIDAVRYPTVGLFSPLVRDPRIIYWDPEVYPAVRSIASLGNTLDPAGTTLVPIIGLPGDPFVDFMVATSSLGPEQVLPTYRGDIRSFLEAGGVAAQQGDALVDPYLLEQPSGLGREVRSQFIDDANYPRDTLLSARPQTVVRYADCFTALIPVFQRALADYLDDPEPTTELIVELSASFGYPGYDADLATIGLRALTEGRLAGNGRNEWIGDIDMGHLRDLVDDVIPVWIGADVPVPSGLEPQDVATNRFIDRSIGR